jgi:hypothetical protein
MALDTWPIIPIVVDFVARGTRPQGMRNIIAALKQHNRVCSINIQNIPNSLLKKFAVLRKPFPALTELKISSGFGVAPIVPDSFLGGSTPQLRTLQLDGIPFPALGNLLLSTSNLVDLDLQKIPHSGYVSPQVIVASLSSSIGLKKLALGFRSPQSWDDQANWDPPPLTRIVLPTLTRLMFKGDSQYLEAIVSRIDAPLLDSLEITFFNQLMFDTPLLGHFISRTETFTAVHRADVDFELSGVQIALVRRNETSDTKILTLLILCKQSDWQPSSIAQVCNSIIPPLPTLGKLRIGEGLFLQLQWYDDMENTEWLELLQPFTCVKDLVLSERLVPFVAPALQELDGERVTQMLPVLQDVFLEGSQPSGAVKEAMERFIAVRRLSGHPVTMRALDAELNSYPPDIMGEAKLRAGLGDRDAQSLTLEEKVSRRLLAHLAVAYPSLCHYSKASLGMPYGLRYVAVPLAIIPALISFPLTWITSNYYYPQMKSPRQTLSPNAKLLRILRGSNSNSSRTGSPRDVRSNANLLRILRGSNSNSNSGRTGSPSDVRSNTNLLRILRGSNSNSNSGRTGSHYPETKSPRQIVSANSKLLRILRGSNSGRSPSPSHTKRHNSNHSNLR